MLSNPQPFWVSGKPLRAKDLVDLESYIFSHNQLLYKSYGIHDMNVETSVRYSVDKNVLSVFNIEGITESGHPIRVGEEGLSVRLEEPFETTIAISIEVNPFYENYLEDGGQSKLVLRAGNIPSENSNTLSLGKYTVDHESGSVRISSRPPVTQLCALKPWDDDWKKWTEPVSHAVLALSERINEMSDGRGVETLYATACKIAFNWPYMRIQELSYQLQFARWMHCLLMDRVQLLGEPFELSDFSPYHSGDDLPQALSQLLDLDRCPDQFGQEINSRNYDIQRGELEGELIVEFLQPVLPGTLKIHVAEKQASQAIDFDRMKWSIKVENEHGENQFVPLFDVVDKRAAQKSNRILIYNIPLQDGIQRKRRLFIRFPNSIEIARVFHIGKRV